MQYLEDRTTKEARRQQGHDLGQLQWKWAQLSKVPSNGASTPLHWYAHSGNAAMIRSTLREWRGENDWLSTPDLLASDGAWTQWPGYRTSARSAEEEKHDMATLSLVDMLRSDVVAPRLPTVSQGEARLPPTMGGWWALL